MHPGFTITAWLSGETTIRFWISWCPEDEKLARAKEALALLVMRSDAWTITDIT